jgi:hypothetical protein
MDAGNREYLHENAMAGAAKDIFFFEYFVLLQASLFSKPF